MKTLGKMEVGDAEAWKSCLRNGMESLGFVVNLSLDKES